MTQAGGAPKIETAYRGALMVGGGVGWLLAGLTAYFPPEITAFAPQCADAACTATVSSESDAVVLLLLGLGALMFIVGANGRAVVSLKIGDAEVATDAASALSAEKTLQTPQLCDALVGSTDDEAEADTLPPAESSTIVVKGMELAVVPAKKIPPKVLAALFDWMKGQNIALPKALDDLEFAARRQGRGNHPWLIKFYTYPDLFKVSAGGRAKHESSVEALSLK